MARKFVGKKMFGKKKVKGRRRLQPAASTVAAALGAGKVIKRAYNNYKARQTKAANARALAARTNFRNRLEGSDNITTAKAVIIGTQRPIGFQEKVSRTIRPPLLFKRNYGFSAESTSGRKAMFSMDINTVNNTDLQVDLTTYKNSFYTDTTFASGVQQANSAGDGTRFYVDKHTEKIQMVNSSTNSLTGKIHLIAHRRDVAGSYDGALLNPVNMLMYYSTVTPASQVADIGGSQTVGNGWVFTNGGTATVNYNASHQMPGSSLNSAGACAFMDPMLSFSSSHVKQGWNYWFRKVSTSDFSLKPGQQFNSSFIFNDLPVFTREEQISYTHLAGISYSVVVEFQSGIVGDATVTTGDNVVSIGTAQLSVIRESTRMLGVKNTLRSKILLQTAPLATIAINQQVIINSDSGDAQVSQFVDA